MTVAINHSDPGAVPGASTKAFYLGKIFSENRYALFRIMPDLTEGFGGGETGSTRA
jgi:hypothetical protein